MEPKTVKKKAGPSAAWALLLAWLASVLLVALAAILVLMTTLTSRAYMKNRVEKSAFADAAYALLQDNFISYGASTGFSREVMTSFFTRAEIAADMDKSVDDLYNGDTAVDLRNEVANNCYDALTADVQNRGLALTDSVKTGLAVVADACRQDYSNYVGVPLASQIYTLVTKLNRVLWIGLVLGLAFAAAALLLSTRLAGNPRMGVRCLIFSFTSAAVLCLLAAAAVYPSLRLGSINIQPASLRLLLLSYVQGIFSRFGIFAAVYGAVAAALFALTFMAHGVSRRRAGRPQQ